MRHINFDLQASHNLLMLLDHAAANTESIIDVIPGVFLVINPAHEILRVNDEFLRLAGMDEEQALRSSFSSYFDRDNWQIFLENMAEITGPEPASFVVKFDATLTWSPGGDGKPYYWILTRLKMEARGEGQLILVFGQDMSAMRYVIDQTEALHKALADLGHVIENLHRAQDELVRSEKLAALGSLVAGVAHELNTPIGNGLMVASHLVKSTERMKEALVTGLRRTMLDEFIADAASAGEVMERNLKKAAELVSSFKQVAVDQSTAQRREFRFDEMVSEIVSMFGPTLRLTPYTIVQKIPDDIIFDSFPGPLGQVLTNIINNAIFHGFREKSSGQIVIEASRSDDGETIMVKVSDDGRGMADDVLPFIFDPFFTTNRGSGGVGLGLNIAHNIVTGILGGKLTATSTLGKGTCFLLELARSAPSPEVLKRRRRDDVLGA